MTRLVLVLACSLLALQPSLAAEGRHPDAPPETEQFALLIGEWD